MLRSIILMGFFCDTINDKLYIADSSNNRIRVVDRRTNIINTFAGNGNPGQGGDGGFAMNAQLNSPHGVTYSAQYNVVFIADTMSNKIRVVGSDNKIYTFAGTGTPGYSGDGGWPTSAMLYNPNSVEMNDNKMYLADTVNVRANLNRTTTATAQLLAIMSTVHFAEPPQVVCYGMQIKLRHVSTGRTLHSHSINYTGGSHQQQVTCFGGDDDNDIWIVKAAHNHHEKAGRNVDFGDVIRLEHKNTRRNLHSHHGISSPTTQQQEVTCYGNNGQGDDNDNWILENFSGHGHRWEVDSVIRLRHKSTNQCLHSHKDDFDLGNGERQGEVTGFGGHDDNDRWQIKTIC
jgi:hypothetical protein